MCLLIDNLSSSRPACVVARILILVLVVPAVMGSTVRGQWAGSPFPVLMRSLLAWLADADVDKRRNTMLKNTQT